MQTPACWNLIGRSLCYRPAVFSLHILFIALSFPQEILGATVKNIINISVFYFLKFAKVRYA
jgi:hypothetical protein